MTNVDIVSTLRSLYVKCFSLPPQTAIEVTPIPQAGGDRRYFRLMGAAGNCIGTFDPDFRESLSFLNLADAFHAAGCSVPRILAVSADCLSYLQEDLGDVSLFSKLKDQDAERCVAETLDALVMLQKTPARVWHGNVMSRDFNTRQVMWDLNYFKYEFLKPSDVAFDEEELENDFMRFSLRLTSIPERFWGFMMRDCQSRNVMWKDGPVFIDFQGGRRGPVLYDAVSLLWQARAGFSPEFRERMLLHYANAFCGDDHEAARELLAYKNDMILFRTLQVLGAYGFRGLVQHRSHFIVSIPGAMNNLRELVEAGTIDGLDELKRVCQLLVADKRYMTSSSCGQLRVEVFSFSYKKGYPVDMSGNGGGFMFDCRAMHNPGRYEEYKHLTGRDVPVVRFLEKRGEVQSFLKGAWSLTDPAVERYLSRGFSNLQIGFGCTGGQHRSVYCAEATARHLRLLFPEANIILTHREHPSD